MTVVENKQKTNKKETIGITAEMIHVDSREMLEDFFISPLINERNFLEKLPKGKTYEEFRKNVFMHNIGANKKQKGITKSLKNDGYNPAYGTVTVIPFYFYYLAYRNLVDYYYYQQFFKNHKLVSVNHIIETVGKCIEIMNDEEKTFDQKVKLIKKLTKGMYVPVSGITRFSRLCMEGVIFERNEGGKKVKKTLPFSVETFSSRFAGSMKETFEDSNFSEEMRCRAMKLCIMYLLSRYNIDSRSASSSNMQAFRAEFVNELIKYCNDKENVTSKTNGINYFNGFDMYDKIQEVILRYFGNNDAMFNVKAVPYIHQCVLTKKLLDAGYKRQSVGRYTKFMSIIFSTKTGTVKGYKRKDLMKEFGINSEDLSFSERKVEISMDFIDKNINGRPASAVVSEFKNHLAQGGTPFGFFDEPLTLDVNLEKAKQATAKLSTLNQLHELKTYIVEMEKTLA